MLGREECDQSVSLEGLSARAYNRAVATDFNALEVFVKVVQTGSITAGARALGVPKSTASQRISELEERLGARLLQRTTRKLSLTDQGRIYYEHCLRIFAEVEEADRAVTSLQGPRGKLRITVPTSTQFLGPVFTDFLRQCAGVQLEVLSTDRNADLVDESIDLAVRAGALSDSTLVARKLGTFESVLVASPRYLGERGRPRTPEDLAKHDCLLFGPRRSRRSLHLVQGDTSREVAVTPKLAANDLDLVLHAVLGGVGIASLPVFHSAEGLRDGRLERVLPDWDSPTQPVYALYPSGRHLSSKVKTMIDHLQKMTFGPWARRELGAAEDGEVLPPPARPRGR